MKERNGKEEGSSRVSRDSESGEKQLKVKDPSSHGNGGSSEEHYCLKRRKEEDCTNDRWTSDRLDTVIIDHTEIKGESLRNDVDLKDSKDSKDKSSKSKESKSLADLKRNSRTHDSEKNEVNGGFIVEKERVELRRKSEKESGRRESHHHVKDVKESKEKDKDRGSNRDRKVKDVKRDVTDEKATWKQGSRSVDLIEDRRHHKRGRENTDWPIQDELRNLELEKELEKRIRRRDGSGDKVDKHQDDLKESDDWRLSLKDVKYKDTTRHKEDKYCDEGNEKDNNSRQKEDKYQKDAEEKDRKHREVKYREDDDRENRHNDKNIRHRDDRESRHNKYREDADKDSRKSQREDKHRDDGDNDNRYWEEGSHRDSRHSRYREDVERERESSRHRDGEVDREKRARDSSKYRDRHSSRDCASESDSTRLRDEGNAGGGDVHHRKSSVRNGSPVYDDRVSRHMEDNRRRDEEDRSNDVRSWSTREQHTDAEKRSSISGGAKVQLAADWGTAIMADNADAEIRLNHGHPRSSPSSGSHAARDHYRNSKQEESKYRGYNYEERIRHHMTSDREFTGTRVNEKHSSSWSLEKSIQRVSDGSHAADASVERRLRSDACGSPMQLVDKSPSSNSSDCHLFRPDARRSLDIDEIGQRSFKDSKDYTGKEVEDTHPGDELSQADDGSSFVSSPFTATTHFSGNSRYLLPPPPPFRSETKDESGGKKLNNNRHRSNMVRNQGNTWKSAPAWLSSISNGLLPFQLGPPSVGFHPVMQQYPVPPLFNARPSMELNHAVPYHIQPDNDRFPGHRHWRNPAADESCQPIWDANNVYGEECHLYGWNSYRSQMNNRGWEVSGDMWKVQKSREYACVLPSLTHVRDDSSSRGLADEKSDQYSPNEQNQVELPLENINVSQSTVVLKAVPVTSEEESQNISQVSLVKDDAYFCHVYLSKIDISADLAQPQLYDKCRILMDIDKDTVPDGDDEYPKILYLEEIGETKSRVRGETSSASLFAAISDTVYQKAMSIYKKQREEMKATKEEQISFLNAVDHTPVKTANVNSELSETGKEASSYKQRAVGWYNFGL